MEKLDYVVVGSGIAGIHTAYRLQEQGKKVLVLEKESYIGGRMSSHLIDGRYFDFGAKFIANKYKNMIPLAKELGVEPVPVDLMQLGILKKGKLFPFDAEKRFSSAWFYGGLPFFAKLRIGIACAVRLFKYKYLDFYNLGNNPELDDKSIQDDFRNFAGREGFDHLVESFCQNVIFYPAKDFSRGFSYSMLSKFLTMRTFSFPEGIGELCKKMATVLPVELNIQVMKVQRTPEGMVVIANKSGNETVYRALNVIIAVPGNRVLDILENPTLEEKSFFQQVRYASTVQILCRGKNWPFSESKVIWTLPSEDSSFTSIGSEDGSSLQESGYFGVALREKTYKYLVDNDSLNFVHLKNLIHKEFPDITQIEIVKIQVWESATPKMYPGYISAVAEFIKKSPKNNGIYFCGDYLENPSTEGALTSSIKLLERIS